MQRYLHHGLFIAYALCVSPAHADVSALLEQEWAASINAGAQGHTQKMETTLEPEWTQHWSDTMSTTLIGRLQWDTQRVLRSHHGRSPNDDPSNGPLIQDRQMTFGIREAYLDTEIHGNFIRIGKQQVVWGQADGLKVLDLINPQQFREFILADTDDARIPLWMINAEFPLGDASALQVLWIPDLTYHALAQEGTPYAVSSPLFIPSSEPGIPITGTTHHKPKDNLNDSDIGIQYSTFVGGWDLTANYLYHYHDMPVIRVDANQQGVGIHSEFERNHLIGATASNAFDHVTLRTEIGYNSDTFHRRTQLIQGGIKQSDEVASVIGLDWQGIENTLISTQWFQSHLLDYDHDILRPQTQHTASLLVRYTGMNDTLTIETLALHGFDQHDGVIQSSVAYQLESHITLWVGLDNFYGDEKGTFGQFRHQDRLTVGSQWSL